MFFSFKRSKTKDKESMEIKFSSSTSLVITLIITIIVAILDKLS